MDTHANRRVSVRAERTARGWSRAHLAVFTELGADTIAKVERFGLLTAPTREKLARVFGCEPEELAP